MTTELQYPWFGVVDGDDIEQGDIFESCPIFLPPDDLSVSVAGLPTSTTFSWKERDVIVMSQSCDLVKGREKLTDVLFCALWKRSELTAGHLANAQGMEDARKGQMPAVHVLAAADVQGFQREIRVVDFKRVHSLPVDFVRRRALMGKRLRVLPPYREHLSQSFARYFMRVGLPVDIPPFSTSKKQSA